MDPFETIKVLFLSFLLFSGYVAIDKNISSSLFNWKTISKENYNYEKQSLTDAFSFAATNIFDQGYTREVGAQVWRRLSVVSDGLFLKEGFFLVPGNASEGLVKLILPEGFKDGNLSLKVTADSKYTVGFSPDLKNWQFRDFPGFGEQGLYTLNLKKELNLKEKVYLKFLNHQNGNLNIYFDIFQYSASPSVDNNEYYGILFFPEVDIDYEGKQIIRPAVYAKKNPKTNN